MSTQTTEPAPAYAAPAAAQQILTLSDTTLKVQRGFAEARRIIDKICKGIDNTDLSAQLLDIDRKFNYVFSDARDSATSLQGVIKRFVTIVVPIVQKDTTPLSEKRAIVEMTVEDISNSALQHRSAFKAGMEVVLSDLKEVLQIIRAEEKEYREESIGALNDAKSNIEELAAYVKSNSTLMGRLSNAGAKLLDRFKGIGKRSSANSKNGAKRKGPIQAIFNAIQTISDFITGGPALKATAAQLEEMIQQLVALEAQADKEITQLQNAVHELESLASLIDALGSSANNFQAVWQKVSEDALELNKYLEACAVAASNLERNVIDKVEVYAGLQIALDSYALSV